MSGRRYHGMSAAAGLYLGAFAWGMSTVIGAAYADYSCALRVAISGFLAVIALAVVTAGGYLSWHSSQLLQATDFEPALPARTARTFLTHISIMSAGLFALAILYQIGASAVFNGCER